MKKYIVYGEPGIPASKVASLYGVNTEDCILVNNNDISKTHGIDKRKYIELYPDMTDKYDLKEAVIKELKSTNRILVLNTKTKEIEIKEFNEALFESVWFSYDLSKELSIVKDGEFKPVEEILKELSEDIEKLLKES